MWEIEEGGGRDWLGGIPSIRARDMQKPQGWKPRVRGSSIRWPHGSGEERPASARALHHCACCAYSGCRNRWAVTWDYLRLEAEDIAALRVDERLDPMDVVRAVQGVVAEGLYPCEVLEPATLRVQQWLVDAEVMRVTVDVGNGVAERDHLTA